MKTPLIETSAVLFHAFIFVLIFSELFLKQFKDANIWEGRFFFFLNGKLRPVSSKNIVFFLRNTETSSSVKMGKNLLDGSNN